VRALVLGPGLGPVATCTGQGGAVPGGEVGSLLAGAAVPAVVDADGLNALGTLEALKELTVRRQAPTVITPHEGELTRLAGKVPGPDRLGAAREAAARSGSIVLLKGPTTVVAHPDGRALLANAADARLATAGTGDVLAGMIGAFIARGVAPFEAAALAAHVHGRAARTGRAEGFVAGDLPDLVASWLSALARDEGR